MDLQVRDYRIPVAGQLVETGSWIDVQNPYDDSPIGRVAAADKTLVDRAVTAAKLAVKEANLPLWQRAEILERTALLVREQAEDFAAAIAREAGKPIVQARTEALRAADTLAFSATTARKLAGEVVPMEASQAGEGKVGFTLRVPLGVVAAVTPFNFPLNLVAHKVGPALAAGNSVVLKPASKTPISALLLAECLFEAGLPSGWLHVVPGSGSEVGGRLVQHPDVAAVTFTGSATVGWEIRSKAAKKKVSLELGSTAPLIVAADGDWRIAASKAAVHGFTHAGQSCISVQRILIASEIADPFLERLTEDVAALDVGDPLKESTEVGPLIDRISHDRVANWVEAACSAGGQLLTGGKTNADGTFQPTVVLNPPLGVDLWQEEVFGPVVVVKICDSLEEMIELANSSRYGLQAGVFTASIDRALLAARKLEFGGVLINEVPTYRADQQPYGGVKDSGNAREGPDYAVRELTETRFIALSGW